MEAIRNFFGGIKTEIQRIRWPKGKEMVKFTVATLVLLLFFSIFFYGIDFVIALIRTIGK